MAAQCGKVLVPVEDSNDTWMFCSAQAVVGRFCVLHASSESEGGQCEGCGRDGRALNADGWCASCWENPA